jgi:hypothetical protein
MREHNQAIKWIIPTPVNTSKNAIDNPDMHSISDDGSVDSSLYS